MRNRRRRNSQFCDLVGKQTTFGWTPHLLSTVLLDAVVDVTESGSGQHKGGLLVDQRVEVSLDLENVALGWI